MTPLGGFGACAVFSTDSSQLTRRAAHIDYEFGV
jgi:hypothetical protein